MKVNGDEEMKVVYGIKWIEVEFGQRDEGWRIYKSIRKAKKEGSKDSAAGAYSGGYIGPERPVTVYEIPVECLKSSDAKKPEDSSFIHTDNDWKPRFKAVIR